MAAYIDHVGYRVSDVDWYVNFFRDVFDMPIVRERTSPDGVREVWLAGGMQLIQVPGFDGADGRAHHLALLVDDLEAVRAKALALGCSEMPKHHWVKLPDGLQLELFTALPGAIQAMKELPKR